MREVLPYVILQRDFECCSTEGNQFLLWKKVGASNAGFQSWNTACDAHVGVFCGPFGRVDFESAQNRRTTLPSVERIRRKGQLPSWRSCVVVVKRCGSGVSYKRGAPAGCTIRARGASTTTRG